MRILVALVLVTTLFSCGEKNQFVLHGHIKGVKNDKIVLGTYDRGVGSVQGIDTVNVVDGRFTIEKPSLKIGTYILQLLDAKISLGVILENGNLNLEADRKDDHRGYIQKVSLKGAQNQELVNQFHDMKSELLKQEKYANCRNVAEKLKCAKDHDEYVELNEELSRLAPHLEEEVKTAQLELVQKNKDKYFVTQVFPFLKSIASIEQIKELYAQLPESTQKSKNVLDMMEDVKAKERIQLGKVAPDFTLKTPEGEDLSLTDLRGKIVLVDFWASWCKPCRASFPHMKELYKKYQKKGFEILGVTNDSNHKAWKKAIKDDELPWVNVADEFPVNYSPARVISEYGMDYLPSTVLIDREGVIIAKLLHDDELDKKLKEIFGF
ncbi:TlpA disulfide reductase family protein [Marinifilum fragile]|uniref:TlpA disulfide reductase family protein n=1 Tax=Marinifilum fragile TaxID=570161 RepID=UPI002AA8B1FA|nr:TlpA disulfide reductase family protein [Marinifilum fragile]